MSIKKQQIGKFVKSGFFAFSLLLFVAFKTEAISLKSFFKETLGIGSGGKESVQQVREENVQTLKVLEAEKGLKSIAFEQVLAPVASMDNDDMTLETDKDNFATGAEESDEMHSDNAMYKVQKGDTIHSIAAYFGVSAETIVSFNRMSSNIVTVGEVLEVPSTPGVLYEVKKGDTLAAISKKYSVDMEDVSLFNGLVLSDELSVGDEIFLPGAVEKVVPKAVSKNTSKVATKSKTGKVSDSLVSKYKPTTWARGDTSHLNTASNIKKYASLPNYTGYFMYPAPGTSRTQKLHGHNSADFAGKMGTPILASAGGNVRVAKYGGYNFGYGNYIIITHDNGSETVYAHLSGVSVSPGQRVSKGQVIGALGSSGNSTGPHLHFEIRGAYNPWAW